MSTLTLDCKFKIDYFEVLENIYYCELKSNLNIISPDNVHIESSTGDHWYGKDNDDVIGIDGKDRNIKYFPRGLEKIFKNLKAIDIENGRIQQLDQSDLSPYGNLVYLDLGGNDIKVLQNGVFDYNPKLRVIALGGNNIYHIDANVFDGLRNLNYLVLEGNKCINEKAIYNWYGVKNIIRNIKIRCQHLDLIDKKAAVLDEINNDIDDERTAE